MAHVVLFNRLAFQKHKLDENGNPTIEPDGPEEIVYKGHPVPDYVPDWQLQALAQSGMIVPVADVPQPVARPDAPAEPQGPAELKPTDSRAAWEEYATSKEIGMGEEEAQAFPNKGALIDAVNARKAQK